MTVLQRRIIDGQIGRIVSSSSPVCSRKSAGITSQKTRSPVGTPRSLTRKATPSATTRSLPSRSENPGIVMIYFQRSLLFYSRPSYNGRNHSRKVGCSAASVVISQSSRILSPYNSAMRLTAWSPAPLLPVGTSRTSTYFTSPSYRNPSNIDVNSRIIHTYFLSSVDVSRS